MGSPSAIAALLLVLGAAQATRFVFQNNYGQTVWVGSQGNSGKQPVNGGGWEMPPGSQVTLDADNTWAGRFWPRTGCNSNGYCETGDCGSKIQCNGAGGVPPVTLAEITLNGYGGNDFYDISLVDGSSIPVAMEPLDQSAGGGGDQYRCARAACSADINSQCPEELRQYVNGRVVACKSACLAFNTDQYCCRNAHNTPETCKSSDWPTNYPAFFKRNCPDAYSYAYDDHKSTFTCSNTGYKITFG